MLARRVLIIDNEQILRTLMVEILCRSNFDPIAVENGVEALQLLSEDSAFVLIVSDVFMPEMDGAQLLKELQRDYPHIPVLMSSVHSTSEVVKKLIQEEMVDYLPRPFTARQFVNAVNKAVESKSPH